MSMKPCPHEQDVFLTLHGEAPLIARLKATIHRFTCPECRARLAEYRRLTGALATLRPSGPYSVRYRPVSSHSIRLALLAAVLALAAAAFSYYYASSFLVARAAESGSGALESGSGRQGSGPADEECAEGAEAPIPVGKGKRILRKAV